MSESIKITIVGGQINGDTDRGIDGENPAKGNCGFREVTHRLDATLMSTLLENQLISGNFCGGRGVCGRCRVQFVEAAPIPTSMERRAFSPEELRSGFRLACMTKPKNNCVIRLDCLQEPSIEVVTDMIDVSGKSDLLSQTQNGKNDMKLIAVDLGTTTIAMQLMDIKTGRIEDTYCTMNPQRSYGADVLSRIQAANAGEAGRLRESVWEVLQRGTEKFYQTLERASVRSLYEEKRQICCMCIAGNTTMVHLLMGLSTEHLGSAPFKPADLGLQKCVLSGRQILLAMKDQIKEDQAKEDQAKRGQTKEDQIKKGYMENIPLPVYVLPGMSAFVGGDITAGLYHCHMLALSKPALQMLTSPKPVSPQAGHVKKEGAILFIDLGTNGEMAITDGKRMIVTATAAGPAFEGGAGAAVQGSDMIAVTAALLKEHIIDESGLLADPYFEQGVTLHCLSGSIEIGDTTSGMYAEKGMYARNGQTGGVKSEKPLFAEEQENEQAIYLTQKDIRDLQMAKAAVRAGVEILYKKLGCPEIVDVYLAGGFGYYLNVDAAIAIGLLPEHLRGVVTAVGNTSLAGAFLLGRDLYTGKVTEQTLTEQLQRIESVNLAGEEEFDALYVSSLNFPECEDK